MKSLVDKNRRRKSVWSCLLFPSLPDTKRRIVLLVGAIVFVWFGMGTASHPWIFLAIGLFLWKCAPVVDHADTAGSLSVLGAFLGWMIGAVVRWSSEAQRPSSAALEDASDPLLEDVHTSRIVAAWFSTLRRIRRERPLEDGDRATPLDLGGNGEISR